jgi:hypothetical protein
MYWPRLILTTEEKEWSHKYSDPTKSGRPVIRRMYPGHLELSSTQRQDVFNFQISRRSRIFGLTLSGDVEYFQLQIQTSSGELHTADPVFVPQLMSGYNQSPLGLWGAPVVNPTRAGGYQVPYIFEPNILLYPNQTVQFRSLEVIPFDENFPDQRLDMVLHVWEFPGMPGSPL